MNLPPQQLVIRIGQVDSPSDPPLTGGAALYRLVNGGMPVCAKHLLELGAYQSEEARAVLTMDQIEALVVEFGLRREDLMLYGPQELLFGEEKCLMCETLHVDGNACCNDFCKKPLHPQWPTVYCSNTCALEDA